MDLEEAKELIDTFEVDDGIEEAVCWLIAEVERLTIEAAKWEGNCNEVQSLLNAEVEEAERITTQKQKAESERDQYKTALEMIAAGTEDEEPPFRAAPREVLIHIAADTVKG